MRAPRHCRDAQESGLPLPPVEMKPSLVLVTPPRPLKRAMSHPDADIMKALPFGEHWVRESLAPAVKIGAVSEMLPHRFRDRAFEISCLDDSHGESLFIVQKGNRLPAILWRETDDFCLKDPKNESTVRESFNRVELIIFEVINLLRPQSEPHRNEQPIEVRPIQFFVAYFELLRKKLL